MQAFEEQITTITEQLSQIPPEKRSKVLSSIVASDDFDGSLADFVDAKIKSSICSTLSESLQIASKHHHKAGEFKGILAACVSNDVPVSGISKVLSVDRRSVIAALQIMNTIQHQLTSGEQPRKFICKAEYTVTRIAPALKSSIVDWILEHTVETADMKNVLWLQEQGVWIQKTKHYRTQSINEMFRECKVNFSLVQLM